MREYDDLAACEPAVLRGQDYPLRSTIAGIEAKLDPLRFARIHLKDATVLPCSRRHREDLRARIGA